MRCHYHVFHVSSPHSSPTASHYQFLLPCGTACLVYCYQVIAQPLHLNALVPKWLNWNPVCNTTFLTVLFCMMLWYLKQIMWCLFSDVRTKAFQATDQFLQIAKQHHEKVYITSLLFMIYPLCWTTLAYQYFAFNDVRCTGCVQFWWVTSDRQYRYIFSLCSETCLVLRRD